MSDPSKQAEFVEPDNVEQTTAPCLACGMPISANASICPTCKSYQRPWRNTLNYFAGIAGFIAVIGSAGAFMTSHVLGVVKKREWHDSISIAVMESKNQITLLNSGDGDILVTAVDIYVDAGENSFNGALDIDQIVKKSSFLQVKLKNFDPYDSALTEQIKANNEKDSQAGPKAPQYEVFLYTKDGQVTQKILAEAFKFSAKRCLSYELGSRNSPSLNRVDETYKSSKKNLIYYPARADINWISAHTGKMHKTPTQDIIIIFYLRK